MTEQERNEHRAQLRAAKSEEEREQIRRAHHDHMRHRAQERGMTLPDEPPARGGGTGLGPGPGVGPGGGAGPGRGR
jgi:1,2-phenylacetyl-CoA epoxidase catalytic subunit